MCASTHGKKLKQELNKAQKEVNVYIDTTFEYIQDLFDESLVQKWSQVMRETCCIKGYVCFVCIHVPNKKRGFSFKSLAAYMCAWLLK